MPNPENESDWSHPDKHLAARHMLMEARAKNMRQAYQNHIEKPGKTAPVDPLKICLTSLAGGWDMMLYRCSDRMTQPLSLKTDTLSGVPIKAFSDLADELIHPKSRIYPIWREYWRHTQAILYGRAAAIDDVELAFHLLQQCMAILKYDLPQPIAERILEINKSIQAGKSALTKP
jgi:hypothetical protein